MHPTKYQLIWQGAIYEPISLEDIIMGQWEVDGVMYKDFEDNEKGQQVSTTRKDYIFFSEDENDFGVWRQFTGLTDRNGKEIYFGDIVRNRRTMIYTIKWYDRANCIAFYSADYDKTPASFPVYNNDMEYTEVIGNIYENPELLNQ